MRDKPCFDYTVTWRHTTRKAENFSQLQYILIKAFLFIYYNFSDKKNWKDFIALTIDDTNFVSPKSSCNEKNLSRFFSFNTFANLFCFHYVIEN